MGRAAIRGDKRRRSRAFALADREIALIDVYAEREAFTRSQALRQLLKLAEERLPADVLRDAAVRRAELARDAKQVTVTPRTVPACPHCGDKDLYVTLPGERWRCDNCLASG